MADDEHLPAPASQRVVITDRGDVGERIDLVVRRHVTDINAATRTRIQRWIAAGRVTLNGRVIERVATRVGHGDVLAVTLPDGALGLPMEAEDIPLVVLHEDEHLLALDKPAGVVAHPTRAHRTATLMNALLWHARGWPAPQRPSLVGRLDRFTTGIVLVAKTARMHAALQRAATPPACEKDYLTVVYGRVREERGAIALAIRDDGAVRRKVGTGDTHGKASTTHFERLAHVEAGGVGLSLLRCRLGTGRTHQIRAHLSACRWPIVGDAVYGERRWAAIADPELANLVATFPRQALHAWRIGFTHPVSGLRLRLEAPIPPDLAGLLAGTGLPAAPDSP